MAKTLVILSTQRSGSTMLCDDLSLTGVLGCPSEHFTEPVYLYSEGASSEVVLVNSIENSFAAAKGENGVSSYKVMSNHIITLGLLFNRLGFTKSSVPEESFFTFFSAAVFIRIFRDDKFAQAVSRYIALSTGHFHKANDVDGFDRIAPNHLKSADRDESNVVYDYEGIKRHYLSILEEEEYLDFIIKSYKIEVASINYESIVVDRSYLFDIAASVGVSFLDMPNRRIQKIGSNVSIDFSLRFKTDFFLEIK